MAGLTSTVSAATPKKAVGMDAVLSNQKSREKIFNIL